jgi:SAM-dependent methyltransferase
VSARIEPEVGDPPPEYMKLVCGDVPNPRGEFDRVGRALARGLARVKMLESGARLLDIGCGCGRVARHLLDSPISAYAGFDRHPGMIEWAQSHIASRDNRFEFQYVDVQSGYEELDSAVGTVAAVEFVFPYGDGSFTGALAASVFTHIDFAATSRYLSETARVLAPGGVVLASFFPGEATGKLGGSNWNFGIREHDLRHAIEQAGLEVVLFDPSQPGQNFFFLGKPRS